MAAAATQSTDKVEGDEPHPGLVVQVTAEIVDWALQFISHLENLKPWSNSSERSLTATAEMVSEWKVKGEMLQC